MLAKMASMLWLDGYVFVCGPARAGFKVVSTLCNFHHMFPRAKLATWTKQESGDGVRPRRGSYSRPQEHYFNAFKAVDFSRGDRARQEWEIQIGSIVLFLLVMNFYFQRRRWSVPNAPHCTTTADG